MALINKIREKSGWAVGAVAIGLGLFVVGGDLLGPNSRIMGGPDNSVGEIAGQEISYQEFDMKLEELKQNFAAQNGRQPSESEIGALREQAWNQLIFSIAYTKQFEELGFTVTDEELQDMVQGKNMHEVVRQSFTNPQTGQFDRAQLISYLKNFDKLPPEQQQMWLSFEQSLRTNRLQTKYENLIRMSNYVTSAEAKRYHVAQNSKANIRYMQVPYATIADSTVEVTDSQLQAYLDKHKSEYKVEDGRSIEYVVVPVNATTEDSAYYAQEGQTVARNFEAAQNDSLFVVANSDAPFNPAYRNVGELPEELRNRLPLQEGQVIGPITRNGAFTVYKVTDVNEEGPAAVRASHILIKPENETPEAKAEAQNKAKDILNQIKGGADFAQMAQQHGTDGTASVGGDLGWFTEGRMVPEFEKAVFGYSGTGLLPNLVETQFGYHIIKVTEPKTTTSYQIAAVERSVSPGDAARDESYRIADELAGSSSNMEEFRANAAQNPSLIKGEAENIRKSDNNISNLEGAREMVRWAYSNDTEVGEISPVFTLEDKYVVAVLTKKQEKGYATVDDVREQLTAAVRQEEKANKILARLNAQGSLNDMAKSYGQEAAVRAAEDLTLANPFIPGLGVEPEAVGKAFGLKEGNRTEPFAAQSGVLAVELSKLNAAAEATPNEIAMYRQQIQGGKAARTQNSTFEVIREAAEIKDNRVRFF